MSIAGILLAGFLLASGEEIRPVASGAGGGGAGGRGGRRGGGGRAVRPGRGAVGQGPTAILCA